MFGVSSFWSAGQQKRADNFCLDFPPAKSQQGLKQWRCALKLPHPGVFWKGETFVLENKHRPWQTRNWNQGVSPEPHLGRFCTFLWNRLLFLLSETACTTRPRLRCFHTALFLLQQWHSQRKKEILLEIKVERKIKPLKLTHLWLYGVESSDLFSSPIAVWFLLLP